MNKEMAKFLHRLELIEKSNNDIAERLDRNDGKTMDIEVDLQAKEREIRVLKDLSIKQSDAINNLQIAVNEAEQYSRRNCLKFFGVAEHDGEDTDEVVCTIAKEKLGVELSKHDIDRSHRVAVRNNERIEGKKKKTRTIVMKFTSYRKRNEVLRSRRKLKGSGIGIDESLTSVNQDLIFATKKHERVKEAWASDGRIIALLATTGNRTIKRQIGSKDELSTL